MRLALASLAVIGTACGGRTPAPADPTTYALFRDLERHVTVTAATGWTTDHTETEAMLPDALDSVCRADPLARRSLAEWLAAEERTLGGPVEQAFLERGRKLSAVEELLVITRVRALLARAEAASGDCPFWIEPEHPFQGRQISEHRWQLVLGGGGQAIGVVQGDHQDISAGGGGRALIGHTWGANGLYLGGEVSGSAEFPRDEVTGMRGALVLGADLVGLAVFRHTLVNAFYEGELGWVGRSTERDWSHIDQGFHLGASFGARALRRRFVFPGAALAIAWEHLFVDGADITTIKVGARVTFDLDL